MKNGGMEADVSLAMLPREIRSGIASSLKLVPCQADEATLEFLRFAKLALFAPPQDSHPERFIPVTPVIDQIWHFCILQTREYASLCETLRSGHFLHHRTFLYDRHLEAVPEVERLHQEDLSWIASYVDSYGKFTDTTMAYWRIPLLLMKELSWTVSDVNAFGRELVLKAT